MALEHERKSVEATDDVLRRIGAVDAKHEQLGPRRSDAILFGEHCGRLLQRIELCGIDPDRVGNRLRSRRRDRLARLHEASAPALGVKADDVARAETFMHRPAKLL